MFTYTINYQPFNPAVPVPYVIAIVELEEQADLRIATNIVDCEPDSVDVGLPVEVRFERHDVDDDSVFVPVFAPRAGLLELTGGHQAFHLAQIIGRAKAEDQVVGSGVDQGTHQVRLRLFDPDRAFDLPQDLGPVPRTTGR